MLSRTIRYTARSDRRFDSARTVQHLVPFPLFLQYCHQPTRKSAVVSCVEVRCGSTCSFPSLLSLYRVVPFIYSPSLTLYNRLKWSEKATPSGPGWQTHFAAFWGKRNTFRSIHVCANVLCWSCMYMTLLKCYGMFISSPWPVVLFEGHSLRGGGSYYSMKTKPYCTVRRPSSFKARWRRVSLLMCRLKIPDYAICIRPMSRGFDIQ